MKKLIFTLGLIGILAISASAQNIQSFKPNFEIQELLPEGESLTFYPEYKRAYSDRVLSLKSPKQIINEPVKDKNLSYYLNDNMPNLEPEGMYSLRLIKPNTEINYTLLIKKPLSYKMGDKEIVAPE